MRKLKLTQTTRTNLLLVGTIFATAFAVGSGGVGGHAQLVAHTNSLNPPPLQRTKLKPVEKIEYVQSAPQASAATPSKGSGGKCSGGGSMEAKISCCESGGSPTARNSSGAAGKYQYMPGTWNGYGGYSSADQAPESTQDAKFRQDTSSGNYNAWNASRHCWG